MQYFEDDSFSVIDELNIYNMGNVSFVAGRKYEDCSNES